MVKTVGVIGGSGLYEMAGLAGVERTRLTTPFGDPSDEFVSGTLSGVRLIFLPRHGRGHRILPSEVNFRANIYGMKKLGAEWIIGVGAVGSLREEIRPGDLVVPDQLIDRTYRRPSTFFGNGLVAHVTFADPFCPVLSSALVESAARLGATAHPRGTYVCMEGPQFSTRAESFLYRQWGADVIGMTNLQEAKLAREAEICFATLALATDYDCWHEVHDDVVIGDVLRILGENVAKAQSVIADAVPHLPGQRSCACARALQHAIITDRARVPEAVRRDLAIIIGKYL
ncbi:MAG TPA: S-methyl-5'-thioadenosine phosphorylase [Candidatus Margulisiibacteriota bacterium]|nr:S-methyl-5'-thioadenosine phosphorylase [Candidatus Margulisiibacteriota bacterium]